MPGGARSARSVPEHRGSLPNARRAWRGNVDNGAQGRDQAHGPGRLRTAPRPPRTEAGRPGERKRGRARPGEVPSRGWAARTPAAWRTPASTRRFSGGRAGGVEILGP